MDTDYLEATGPSGLAYTVDRLASTTAFLRFGRGMYVLECEQLHDSVLYEFLVHARNLVEFLFGKPSDNRNMYATQFMEDPEEWSKDFHMGALPKGLNGMWKDRRIHWMMAHLTWRGLEVSVRGGPEKSWPIRDIAVDLLGALEAFANRASPERIDRRSFMVALERFQREVGQSLEGQRTQLRVCLLPYDEWMEARMRMGDATASTYTRSEVKED